MYYSPDYSIELIKIIEHNIPDFNINFFKRIISKEENFSVKLRKIREKIMKIKLLICKIDEAGKDYNLETCILQNFKGVLELYFLGWFMAEKILSQKEAVKVEKEKMKEKGKEKEEIVIEDCDVNEAMKLLLQAEARLEKTKNLLICLKGNEMVEASDM